MIYLKTFWVKLKNQLSFVIKTEVMIMAEVSAEQIKEAEDSIRDLINWVEVWNLEEVQDGTKKIEDETVNELKAKLEEIARKVGGMAVL